jgi:hypothetical protein
MYQTLYIFNFQIITFLLSVQYLTVEKPANVSVVYYNNAATADTVDTYKLNILYPELATFHPGREPGTFYDYTNGRRMSLFDI